MPFLCGGRLDRDRMVVGFTTTCAIGGYHLESCDFDSCSCEVCSIQHYVIKFVSDLRQVSGYCHDIAEILLKVVLNTINHNHILMVQICPILFHLK